MASHAAMRRLMGMGRMIDFAGLRFSRAGRASEEWPAASSSPIRRLNAFQISYYMKWPASATWSIERTRITTENDASAS